MTLSAMISDSVSRQHRKSGSVRSNPQVAWRHPAYKDHVKSKLVGEEPKLTRRTHSVRAPGPHSRIAVIPLPSPSPTCLSCIL